MNLRDNPDGTCNCRPLMGGCFFTDGFEGRCDCKCHIPQTNNTEKKEERKCKNGHRMTGIGFDTVCPECEAEWDTPKEDGGWERCKKNGWPKGSYAISQTLSKEGDAISIKKLIEETKSSTRREVEEELNDCACKEKWTFGVVHRKNKPCYLPPPLPSLTPLDNK